MGLCIWHICENEKKKRRTKWMKTWIQEKNKYGHMQLIRELRANEQDDLKNYLRMPGHVFDELLSKYFNYFELKLQQIIFKSIVCDVLFQDQ